MMLKFYEKLFMDNMISMMVPNSISFTDKSDREKRLKGFTSFYHRRDLMHAAALQ